MSGHVFISYARSDGLSHAERLESDLHGAGYPTWRDKRNLSEYNDFSAEIEMAIRAAQVVTVCITPSIEDSPSSFVRREIIYAQAKDKPIIPLVFPHASVPILINHLTWIPFFDGERLAYEQGLHELLSRLQRNPQPATPSASLDPFRDYLTHLYDWVVNHLAQKVGGQVIELSSHASPDAIQSTAASIPVSLLSFFDQLAGVPSHAVRTTFTHFAEAFDAYQGRVLLLGEPGAGKSTTLMAFARDAIVRRLDDVSRPLPVLAPIVAWDAYRKPSLGAWLAGGGTELQQVIEQGRALLLLDGLDELGSERPLDPDNPNGPTFDPRAAFIEALPADNQVVLTCRVKDYHAIGHKAALNGAVTLQPLSIQQIEHFLASQPSLLAAIQRDSRLREMVGTPLLLALFAVGYRNRSTQELQALADLASSAGAVRDRLMQQYVQQRYEHEQRKPYANLPYSLEKLTRILQGVAALDAMGEGENDVDYLYFHQYLGYEPDEFIEEATRLHLLVGGTEAKRYRFIHLMLRDYFAFPQLVRSLEQDDVWRRRRAVEALGNLGDARAVEPLALLLQDVVSVVRRTTADALGKIGDPSAVPHLVAALEDSDWDTRRSVAKALVAIGEPAVEALVGALGSADVNGRRLAAQVLGQVGVVEVLDPLLAALHDPDLEVQIQAATALGLLGDGRAVSGLARHLRTSPDRELEAVLITALEQIGTPDAQAAVDEWRRQ